MNYCERIPVKTAKLELSSGKPYEVYCEGLEVTVLAESGDINITAKASDDTENAYLLKNGQSISICGSFALSANDGSARLLYCKLL